MSSTDLCPTCGDTVRGLESFFDTIYVQPCAHAVTVVRHADRIELRAAEQV